MGPSIGAWGSLARGQLDVPVDELYAELPPLTRRKPHARRVLVRPQRLTEIGEERVKLAVTGGLALGSSGLLHWALGPRTRG